MSFTFLAEAEAEYLEAIAFYEDLGVGLGAKLIADFEREMALVVERPWSWKQVHPEGIYRKDLKRFRYAIFYRMFNEAPEVVAFAHHRQRPNYWRGRGG